MVSGDPRFVVVSEDLEFRGNRRASGEIWAYCIGRSLTKLIGMLTSLGVQ